MTAPTDYTFTLPSAVVDLIGKALGKLPWEEANSLIDWFRQSCAAQKAEAEAAEKAKQEANKPAEPEPANDNPAQEVAKSDGNDTSDNPTSNG